MTVRRTLSVVATILALGAVAASVGVHLRLAAEMTLAVATLVLAGTVILHLPRARRHRRRRRAIAAMGDRFERGRAVVAAALESDWGVQTQLVPAVRDVVAARLLASHGISLADEPAAAAAALPNEVAELVARRRPPRTDAPGMTAVEIDRVLTQLEEMG